MALATGLSRRQSRLTAERLERRIKMDEPTLKAALMEVAAFLEDHGREEEYDSDRLKYQFMARELLDLEAWITEDTRSYHPCPECGRIPCAVTCTEAP